MPRATGNVASHRRHKKVLKRAKGFRSRRKNVYRTAVNAVMKAGQHAYNDRKRKKRDFRRLWITRIGAAARGLGLSYSVLLAKLSDASVELDRKILAEIAVSDPNTFAKIVEEVK